MFNYLKKNPNANLIQMISFILHRFFCNVNPKGLRRKQDLEDCTGTISSVSG